MDLDSVRLFVASRRSQRKTAKTHGVSQNNAGLSITDRWRGVVMCIPAVYDKTNVNLC